MENASFDDRNDQMLGADYASSIGISTEMQPPVRIKKECKEKAVSDAGRKARSSKAKKALELLSEIRSMQAKNLGGNSHGQFEGRIRRSKIYHVEEKSEIREKNNIPRAFEIETIAKVDKTVLVQKEICDNSLSVCEKENNSCRGDSSIEGHTKLISDKGGKGSKYKLRNNARERIASFYSQSEKRKETIGSNTEVGKEKNLQTCEASRKLRSSKTASFHKELSNKATIRRVQGKLNLNGRRNATGRQEVTWVESRASEVKKKARVAATKRQREGLRGNLKIRNVCASSAPSHSIKNTKKERPDCIKRARNEEKSRVKVKNMPVLSSADSPKTRSKCLLKETRRYSKRQIVIDKKYSGFSGSEASSKNELKKNGRPLPKLRPVTLRKGLKQKNNLNNPKDRNHTKSPLSSFYKDTLGKHNADKETFLKKSSSVVKQVTCEKKGTGRKHLSYRTYGDHDGTFNKNQSLVSKERQKNSLVDTRVNTKDISCKIEAKTFSSRSAKDRYDDNKSNRNLRKIDSTKPRLKTTGLLITSDTNASSISCNFFENGGDRKSEVTCSFNDNNNKTVEAQSTIKDIRSIEPTSNKNDCLTLEEFESNSNALPNDEFDAISDADISENEASCGSFAMNLFDISSSSDVDIADADDSSWRSLLNVENSRNEENQGTKDFEKSAYRVLSSTPKQGPLASRKTPNKSDFGTSNKNTVGNVARSLLMSIERVKSDKSLEISANQSDQGNEKQSASFENDTQSMSDYVHDQSTQMLKDINSKLLQLDGLLKEIRNSDAYEPITSKCPFETILQDNSEIENLNLCIVDENTDILAQCGTPDHGKVRSWTRDLGRNDVNRGFNEADNLNVKNEDDDDKQEMENGCLDCRRFGASPESKESVITCPINDGQSKQSTLRKTSRSCETKRKGSDLKGGNGFKDGPKRAKKRLYDVTDLSGLGGLYDGCSENHKDSFDSSTSRLDLDEDISDYDESPRGKRRKSPKLGDYLIQLSLPKAVIGMT